MTRYALCAILVALIALIVELWFAAKTTAVGSEGPNVLLLAFLAGPLLFLALITWRRNRHPTRSLLCFAVALLVSTAGIGLLVNDYVRLRTGPPMERTTYGNPVLIPLGQWLAVVALWAGLVVVESREKRATQLPDKKA
jgi:prepilin signal peptidase PulO-like enzyme (type II secretory pathway)